MNYTYYVDAAYNYILIGRYATNCLPYDSRQDQINEYIYK